MHTPLHGNCLSYEKEWHVTFQRGVRRVEMPVVAFVVLHRTREIECLGASTRRERSEKQYA